MQNLDVLDLAKKSIHLEAAAVEQLISQLDDEFIAAAYAMVECKGHVLIAGSGTSRSVGERFAHLLSCCGTPSLFIHPGDSQHGLAGALKKEDVLFALSKGGETTEVNFLAGIAKQKGAILIGLTEKPDSTLGRMCDIVLKVIAPENADPYGMIATGSSLVNSAYCDALCIVQLHLRNYSKEEFSKTHPGGAVGMKIHSQS